MGGKCSSHQKNQSTTEVRASSTEPEDPSTETENESSVHAVDLNQFIDSGNTLNIPLNIVKEEKPFVHPVDIRAVCSLPNNQLAIGGGTTINIWDLKTNKKTTLTITAKWLHNSNKTKTLHNLFLVSEYLVANCNGTLCIWNIKDWKLVKIIDSGFQFASMCAIPTNPLLMAIGSSSLHSEEKSDQDAIQIINIEKLIKSSNNWYSKKKRPAVIIEFGPNYEKGVTYHELIVLAHKKLAVVQRKKPSEKQKPEISIWNYETGEFLGELPTSSEHYGTDFYELSNDELIGISRGETAQIWIWNLNNKTCTRKVNWDNPTHSLCLLPNNTLAASHIDGIVLWNLNTFKHTKVISIPNPQKLLTLSDTQFACVMDINKVQVFNTYSLKSESEVEYAIEALPSLKDIKTINFTSEITTHAIQLLSNVLRTDNTIEDINFTANPITPEEEKSLLDAISENPHSTLKIINCPSNLSFEKRAHFILSNAGKIQKFTRMILNKQNDMQYSLHRPQCYLRRAECYYQESIAPSIDDKTKFDKWQKALSDWNKATQLEPDLPSADLKHIQSRRNEIGIKISQYEAKEEKKDAQRREKEKKEERRRKQEERKAQEENDRREAAERLQRADALFKSAIGKYHAEKFNDSIKDFDESFSLNSNNKSIFYHRGLAKAGFKQHEAAIEDFNQRLVDYLDITKEERAELFYARGLSKVALNNLDEAEKDYQNTLKENERHPHVNDALRKLTQLREQQEREKQQRAWSYQSQASSNAGPTTLFSPNAAPALTEEDRAKIEALKQQMRSQQHGM